MSGPKWLRLMIVFMSLGSGAIALVLLGCLLATAAPLAAQTPDTMLLEELTWTEVRDALRAGKTTVIVPVGGTEQNGPHMALGKHNARVKVLSERIARELGNAIVAPVVAYVPEGSLEPASEPSPLASTTSGRRHPSECTRSKSTTAPRRPTTRRY